MPKPPPRAPTYDDILALPEHLTGEIVAGELHVSPRPTPRHANAASSVMGTLFPFHGEEGGGGPPGGWWVLVEPELHLGRDVLVPDLAAWRRERMPRLPETAAFELTPDWVCEVLSPATARLDRLRKMPAYASHGVSNAWVVDPIAKVVELYRLTPGGWLQIGVAAESARRLEPFDALELDPARWWVADAPP